MSMRHDTRLARRYGEVWTSENGGRWMSGVEVATRALREAGYEMQRTQGRNVWVATHEGMAAQLCIAYVDLEWPHACTLEVEVM